MTTARTIVWLTARQLFARRRIWLVAAITLLPFVLTFFYRLASEDREGDRIIFMLNMYREIVLGVLLPLTAVIFGTLSFGGEVEEGTLVYLLVRPVDRVLVVALKFVVATVITAAIIAVALWLAWMSLRDADLPPRFLGAFVLASTMGAVVYCALFAYLGLVTRRGLVIGLLYVIIFENVITRTLEGIRSLSVREFTISIAQWGSDGLVKWPGYTVPMTTVWVVSAVLVVAAIATTLRTFSRYELAERL